MAGEISLADFNRIATGTYNAGQIDFATGKDGATELVKVNNHVWQTSKNRVQLAPERVLEVKESFIAALERGGVSAENIATIRKEIGIPAEWDATAAGAEMTALAKERYTPLSRQQVRTILDEYANGGRGFTRESRAAVSAKEDAAARKTALAALGDAKTISRRDTVNAMAPAADGSAIHDLEDAFAFMSGTKSLSALVAAHGQPAAGNAAVSGQQVQQGFLAIFKEAVKLLSANVRDSAEIDLWGTSAKIGKGINDTLSVALGKGPTATTVNLGVSAQRLVEELVARALDAPETVGPAAMKEILTTVSNMDEAKGLPDDDRTSQTRQLAAKVLAGYAKREGAGAPAFTANDLLSGRFETKLLARVAQLALDGDGPGAVDILDAASFLSGAKSLQEVDAARRPNSAGGADARDSGEPIGKLRNGFKELFAKALQLLPGDARQSDSFVFCGSPAKIVKGDDGNLSVVLGGDPGVATVKLGTSAQGFVDGLVGRALDASKTLGPATVKDLLTSVLNRDVANGIPYDDRNSLSRRFAASVLARHAKPEAAFTASELVSGTYQTMVLAQIAQRALDGEDAEKFNTRDALHDYHEELKQDSAGLSDEMKAMLAKVAGTPLERPKFGKGELFVHAPGVNGGRPLADADPVAAPAGLGDIGGVAGVKNFIADLIFSDETMVADVVVNLPGETMRGILSDDKKLVALAEIIKDRSLIDKAVAPQIREIVKEGLDRLIAVLDDAFKDANGESLAAAAAKGGFLARFSAFLKDPARLPGAKLATFDGIILSMSTKGCAELQKHVNEVFKVNVAAANEVGAVTTDPYREKSGDAIAADLKDKTLNQILDAAATSDAPGQVGLFKQAISGYFMQLRPADKRSAFAAALRYATTYEFGDKQGDELASAEKAARTAFTGAVLKGTGPLMQKMMQGLPKEMMGEFAVALEDMKAHLAPIPRKIVQAYLMKMINDSQIPAADGRPKPRILSIEVVRSLGAASVGEAFECEFVVTDPADPTGKRRPTQKCVVKIMRHDAELRVDEEGKIFAAAAAKIPGMAATWDGQFRQYKTEFDFRNEARNVEAGQDLYNVRDGKVPALGPKTNIACPNVTSMKMSSLVPPEKNAMVAELVPADTVDKFFKDTTASIRKATSAVFKQDPASGSVVWKDGAPDPVTGVPVKVPDFLPNVSPMALINLTRSLMDKYQTLLLASNRIQQATKAWFFQALLGSGQFHGDAHAGNLMFKSTGEYISFIDFGNLYTLKTQANGVNEKTELLRVMLGAAFRKPEFILKGFEKLMSAGGRAALADPQVREKAEKILGAVLAKGAFSTNIVYRLQAAVAELQKLGLELPPPINCFILSLVRLSNTVTEINSIMGQCRAMLDAVGAIPPDKARDELDLAGRAFDMFAKVSGDLTEAAGDPTMVKANRILKVAGDLMDGKYGADDSPVTDAMCKPDGAYYNKVVDRLTRAEDVCGEAEKLAGIISRHVTSVESHQGLFQGLDQMRNFRADWDKASTQKEKVDLIRAFAETFALTEMRLAKRISSDISSGCTDSSSGRPVVRGVYPPDSFASALMDLIAARLTDFGQPFVAEDKSFLDTLKNDFLAELGFDSAGKKLSLLIGGEDKIMAAIQQQAATDRDGYKITILI